MMPGVKDEDKKPRKYQPWPLDNKILAMLPEEGIIGGAHYRGRQAKHLHQEIEAEIGKGVVSMGQMQARLRELRFQGFAESFSASGGRVWARTEKGIEHLREAGMLEEETNGDAS
jgi:hypothetical protein